MLPVRRKYAIEQKTYTFDFSQKMAAGDTLINEVPTMEIDAGLTASNAVVDVATGTVSVRIGGGLVGQSYFVAATVRTTGGDKFKLGVTIEVTASAN